MKDRHCLRGTGKLSSNAKGSQPVGVTPFGVAYSFPTDDSQK